MFRSALLIAIVLTVSTCTTLPRLPTVATFNGSCRGVGLEGHITGDPNDPRLAWVDSDSGRGRTEVIWPPGFTARFVPRLEILDETGTIAFRDGDPVTGGCTTGSDAQGPILIGPGL